MTIAELDPSETLAEYERLVKCLVEQAARELRAADGRSDAERRACCRYFKRGYTAGLSTGELVDFLGVSSPSALDLANYSDEHALQVMYMVGDLSDEEIAAAVV